MDLWKETGEEEKRVTTKGKRSPEQPLSDSLINQFRSNATLKEGINKGGATVNSDGHKEADTRRQKPTLTDYRLNLLSAIHIKTPAQKPTSSF